MARRSHQTCEALGKKTLHLAWVQRGPRTGGEESGLSGVLKELPVMDDSDAGPEHSHCAQTRATHAGQAEPEAHGGPRCLPRQGRVEQRAKLLK